MAGRAPDERRSGRINIASEESPRYRAGVTDKGEREKTIMNTAMGILSSAVHRSVTVAVRATRGAHPRFARDLGEGDATATANGRSPTVCGVGLVERLLIVGLVALAVSVAMTVARPRGTDVPPPRDRAPRILAAGGLRAHGTSPRPRGARSMCHTSDAEAPGRQPDVAGLSPDCREAARRGGDGARRGLYTSWYAGPIRLRGPAGLA